MASRLTWCVNLAPWLMWGPCVAFTSHITLSLARVMEMWVHVLMWRGLGAYVAWSGG